MKFFLTLILFVFGAMSLNAQITFLESDLEAGIPVDWTQVTVATDGGWIAGTAASLSSASFPIPDNGSAIIATNDDGCNCDKSSDRLILAPVDLSMAAVAVLNYDSYFGARTYQGDTETGSVEVSTDGGTTWTAVAPVTTDLEAWTTTFLDLSSYVGNAEVWVSFNYTDGGGWLYGFALDNIKIFTPPAQDVKLDGFTNSRFHPAGDLGITAMITNLGADQLNTVDFTWTSGATTNTETVSGLTLDFGQSMEITHPTLFNVADAVPYDFTIKVTNPNGINMDDADPTNEDGIGAIAGVSYVPSKKMYVEEATGTWCQFCPRGTEWMDWMGEMYSDDFVGIAVHNGDPMVLTEWDNGIGGFPGFSGYPSVIVDREMINDPSELEDLLPNSLADVAPVAPAITSAVMDVATMSLSIEGNAEFVTLLEGVDYRLNLALTEDGVTGSGAGWDQVNAYDGQQDIIPNFGIDWSTSGNPTPASMLEYNHVGRWLSDGWAGEAGSVATDLAAGDMATKSFSGDFNTDWNPFNMHAIIMVIDNGSATGKVLNSNSSSIEVNCITEFSPTVTTVETLQGTSAGEVLIELADPTLGFGDYTFTLNTGETSEVGTAITGLDAGDYTVVISDKIGCTQEVQATVASISSTEDIDGLTAVTLFPNPTKSISTLTATFDKNVDLNISVVNTVGQVISSAVYDQVDNVTHEINVDGLAAGLYLVKMNVNNQVRTHRLMVK